MKINYVILYSLIIVVSSLLLISSELKAFPQSELFFVSPLCTMQGEITCPEGFKVACSDEQPEGTIPKCIFLDKNYVPGCWKFIRKQKIDFIIPPQGLKELAHNATVKITGGGETYNLNRETIGCRKI